MSQTTPRVNYQLPQNDKNYSAQFDGKFLRVESGASDVFNANVEIMDATARLRVNPFESHEQLDLLLAVGLEHLFSHFLELKKIQIISAQRFDHAPTFAKFVNRDNDEIHIGRSSFYQNPCMWHRVGTENESRLSESAHVETSAVGTPVRPRMPVATHYRRYSVGIQKTISFRTVVIEKDLERFHRWHNDPRVYDLWDLNKPIDELRTYLEQGLKDAHQVPMILELDGVPAGYFEIYWAKEDRLGPYYESEDYDRGFHFLIGEAQFLGAENTDAVLRSVIHFMYLEDSRTQRLVAEPRADNKRVLKYVQIVPGAWELVKEFDFPHKRAALLMSHRERFFNGGAL